MSVKSVALEAAIAAPHEAIEPGNDPDWLETGRTLLEFSSQARPDLVDTRAWRLLVETFNLLALTDPDQQRDAAISVAGHCISWACSIDQEVIA